MSACSIKKILTLALVGIFFLAANAQAQSKDDPAKMQHKGHQQHQMQKQEKEACCSSEEVKTAEVEIYNKFCPVRGGEVDPEVKPVEYKGKYYGFCCPGCDDKFAAEPEKYLKNLSEDGQKFIGKS